MDFKFAKHIEEVVAKYEALIGMHPHTVAEFDELPGDIPKCGIYLFSEGEKHLYVGRTNRLRERLRDQWYGLSAISA